MLDEIVKSARKITTIALNLRKTSGIKVRQPLSEIIVIPGNQNELSACISFKKDILEETNIKRLFIGNDIDIEDCKKQTGFLIDEQNSLTIIIDTIIIGSLIKEGVVREIIRAVQSKRKKIGLEISDRIDLYISTQNEFFLKTLEEFSDKIKEEVLTSNIYYNKDKEYEIEVQIGKEKIMLCVSKGC